MTYAKDIVQIAFWLLGIAFSVVSIVSVVQVIRQYRANTRQRIAQSLIDLELRLEKHWEIMPLLDPASKRYDDELRTAVQNSLEHLPQLSRKDSDRKLILQLDQFLRFLLLLSSLEKYQLLDHDALEYMYHYWFKAVYIKNAHLRCYIGEYFPTLNTWLVHRYGEMPAGPSDDSVETTVSPAPDGSLSHARQ